MPYRKRTDFEFILLLGIEKDGDSMKPLRIKTRNQSNTTVIENEFIDQYMPRANGEFVKVYLYLLRHLNNPKNNPTLTSIADDLENTENDILRALKYWEKKGLLALEYDEDQKICGLDIATLSLANVGEAQHTQLPKKTPKLPPMPKEHKEVAKEVPFTPITNITNSSRKDFKQLLFIAEQYLGKTLTKTDVDTIAYFYDTLHFSTELIDYLIEYCVENGHKSIHYIQSVALAWSDNNVQTISDAKTHCSSYNKDYYTVLKEFGITGRGPVTSEKQMIDKWMKTYGFSIELLCEACNRTMSTIHQPSFEYTDSILSKWKRQNVQHVSDIERLDTEYQQKKKAAKPTVEKIAKKSASNFEPRTYDMADLEKRLLQNK